MSYKLEKKPWNFVKNEKNCSAARLEWVKIIVYKIFIEDDLQEKEIQTL